MVCHDGPKILTTILYKYPQHEVHCKRETARARTRGRKRGRIAWKTEGKTEKRKDKEKENEKGKETEKRRKCVRTNERDSIRQIDLS